MKCGPGFYLDLPGLVLCKQPGFVLVAPLGTGGRGQKWIRWAPVGGWDSTRSRLKSNQPLLIGLLFQHVEKVMISEKKARILYLLLCTLGKNFPCLASIRSRPFFLLYHITAASIKNHQQQYKAPPMENRLRQHCAPALRGGVLPFAPMDRFLIAMPFWPSSF